MIRTQVSLNEPEYQLAKKEAAALGISLAEYVRRAIRQVLRPSTRPRWVRHAGVVGSENPRSGQSIDDIVYGPLGSGPGPKRPV